MTCRCGKLESDTDVDMLLYICCEVSPQARLANFDCKTREDFKKSMVTEFKRLELAASSAHRNTRQDAPYAKHSSCMHHNMTH
jgi:hypothetical protein